MFKLVGSSSYPRKMTEKWGEVQKKLDLANIRVSEEFESSEFELSGFLLYNKITRWKDFELVKKFIKLLDCTWRHSGHVGGKEQKHFSPLRTKLHFHVNSSRKNSIVLKPKMGALSRGCKPRILDEVSTLKCIHQFKKWSYALPKK